MYKSICLVGETIDFEGNKKYETILKAKFKFRKEVTPKNRSNLKKRINTSYLLVNYLKQKGFECQTRNYCGDVSDNFEYIKNIEIKNISQNFEIKISKHKFGIGFNLCGDADFKIDSLEKIINLEELNQFILTGKTN